MSKVNVLLVDENGNEVTRFNNVENDVSPNMDIEEFKRALANVKWQAQQTCKYQLPCGICDKTGEICSWIGGNNE